jgi:hypothetical protein
VLLKEVVNSVFILKKRKKEKSKEKFFTFSSTINLKHRDDLEYILFFNEEQHKYASVIKKIIELYGKPEVVVVDHKLSIKFGEITCQTLFCTEKNILAGLAVFYRDSPENIDLVHIVVDEKYSSTGKFADKFLALKIINVLKLIALKIKGVNTITIKYDQEQVIKINNGMRS